MRGKVESSSSRWSQWFTVVRKCDGKCFCVVDSQAANQPCHLGMALYVDGELVLLRRKRLCFLAFKTSHRQNSELEHSGFQSGTYSKKCCNRTKMAQLPHVTGQYLNVPGVVGGMSKDWPRAVTRFRCPGAHARVRIKCTRMLTQGYVPSSVVS